MPGSLLPALRAVDPRSPNSHQGGYHISDPRAHINRGVSLREAIESVRASSERLRLTREHLRRLEEERRRLELRYANKSEARSRKVGPGSDRMAGPSPD